MTTDMPDDAPEPAPKKPSAGVRRVSPVIGLPVEKIKVALKRGNRIFPNPGMPMDGIEPGRWLQDSERDETGCLPACCPVYPLGYDNEDYYIVDTMGQVFNSGDKALGVERLQKLFAGCEEFLYWAYPAKGAKKMAVDPSFKAERIRRDLFAACKKRGPFSLADMVRGRGAWRGEAGRLILHTGEYLYIDGELRDTGEVDGNFYVRRPGATIPSMRPVVAEDNPAIEIFRMLRTWNMVRGDVDRMLLLGSIGVSMLAGALEWRPSTFIIGDKGTGKSELVGKFGLVRAILGRSMVATTNASEAGLYQLVGHDSLAIAIDELEGDEEPEQTAKIIKMARDAASGSIRIRGGQNHKGVEFQAQSAFYFSGINPPPLPPASMSRLALIQLLPLLEGGKPPVLKNVETVGPRLLRILYDGWERLQYLLDDYYAILREIRYDARSQKTFGTFLAIAHLMLGEAGLKELGLPSDVPADWAQHLAPEDMPEIDNDKPGWLQCLDAVLSTRLDQYFNGKQYSVAQVIDQLRTGISGDPDDGITLREANIRLAIADLGLRGTPRSMEDPLLLCIPNQSRALGKLLSDTPFAARGGNGNWRFALGRGPEDIVKRKIKGARDGEMTNKVTVGATGRQERCTFIDLRQFAYWQAGPDTPEPNKPDKEAKAS